MLAGVAGVLIALLLKRAAFGVAGFLAGGYFLSTTLAQMGWVLSSGYEIAFLSGGVLGAVAAIFLTDWALIILSSLVGAAMIVDALPMEPTVSMVILPALAVVGVIVQRHMFRRVSQPETTERH